MNVSSIIESKNILSEYFIKTLSPSLYENIINIFIRAINMEQECEKNILNNPNFSLKKNPGRVCYFRNLLSELTTETKLYEKDLERIKLNVPYGDYIDDILTYLVKLNYFIIYNTTNEDYFKREVIINPVLFIESCYKEFTRLTVPRISVFNNIGEESGVEIEIFKLLDISINNSIIKLIPLKGLFKSNIYKVKEEIFNKQEIKPIIEKNEIFSKTSSESNDLKNKKNKTTISEKEIKKIIEKENNNTITIKKPIIPLDP